MHTYLALVRLFWQHLVRRKSLWIVVALVGALMLINATIQSQMKGMLEDGVRYDLATRRAAATLEGYAEQIRQGAALLALIVGALLAPASRKEGTTQFVLALSVSRFRLALAQFGALAIFVFLGTLVVHVGYSFTAYRLGILSLSEALFGWAVLLAPLLLLAATSFSLSLTRPALMVYVTLLGIPFMAVPLVAAFIGDPRRTLPEWFRVVSARVVDNVSLLFPNLQPFIPWPRLWLAMAPGPPYPDWGWEAVHQAAAVALWVVVGLWAYRRYDFGSRIPTK